MLYSGDEDYGDDVTSPFDEQRRIQIENLDVWGGPGGRDLYGGATFDRPWMTRVMKRMPQGYQVRRLERAITLDPYDEAAYWAEYRHEGM